MGMPGMHGGGVPQRQEQWWPHPGGAAAPVDDTEEDETYLQRLVELQQGMRWGEASQAQPGVSLAAESSLPDALAHRSAPRPVSSAV